MKRCIKCLMPNTRPGIHFNENGECQACLTEERKNATDWEARLHELEALCDKYRGTNGNGYDCTIAISGGKDSHYQVYVMKEMMGMNPLLVTVEDNFPMTEAGKKNIRNISERFGCDVISMKPNIRIQKNLMRKTFEKYGKPTWYIDRLIYTYPLHMAAKFNTPLLIYGENINYEYGGNQDTETHSARHQLQNGVASDIDWNELLDDEVTFKDIDLCNPPNDSVLQSLDPIYLSYFVRWNSYKNYIFAKKNGFTDLTHEWVREHHVENFDQIDTRGYLVHSWMKYPKFGHASATDYASKFIRYGMITRDEGLKLVAERDHKLDSRTLEDFIEFTGYTHKEFWAIVDKHYNQKLFEKDKYGEWQLKYRVE